MNDFDTARVAPEKAVFRPALPPSSLPGSNGTNVTMTYREQLLHPNWQRKRLEVLQRAEFACEMCFESERTLHVHHKRYVKGRMAWEYDLGELIALCDSCHEYEHEIAPDRQELLARLHGDGPWGVGDFMAYGAGAVSGWISEKPDPRLFELIERQWQASPALFTCGAIAAALSDLLSMPGLARLLTALRGHEEKELAASLYAVLEANGMLSRQSTPFEGAGD